MGAALSMRTLLFLWALCSQSPPQPQQRPASNPATAKQQQRGSDSLPIAVKLLNTGKSAEEATQDSQAVADNRKSNSRQFWLNVGLLVMTVVQSAGLIWTIIASSRTTRQQLRAYLSVSESGIWADDYGDSGRLFITLRNTGQTPAYRLASAVGMILIPVGEVANYTFPEHPDPDATASSTMLGANCEFTLRRRFTKQDAQAVRSGTHRLYIFGKLEYTDAFDRKRFTGYRFYWATGEMNVKNLSRSRDGNDGN